MVYVGGQAGAGGVKIVFGEIPVTTSSTSTITVNLGGTPKYLSVIPKQTLATLDQYALPCAFANPVIGDMAYISNSVSGVGGVTMQITITATGFTAQRKSTNGNTVPFGYLAIM